MLKLLKNCDVYGPEHLGKRDILIAGQKIMLVEPEIHGYQGLSGVEVLDMQGAIVAPGLIDIHVHVTGGGGEQGYHSRTPELNLSELVKSGVTTVLGLLGTDGTSRSLENLLGKVTALETEGLSAYMLTGSYQYPTVTLTGGVLRDIMLIDKIIGAKLAMSDHRSSTVTVDELTRLASDVNMGGMLSGKAGLLTIHTGVRKGMLDPIFQALEQSDVPVETFLPTHVGRNYQLLDQAIKLAKMGGNFDLTAHGSLKEDGESAADMVAYCIRQGVDLDRMTMSSDGNGSQPRFDETGRCIGLTYVSPAVLLWELRRGVQQLNIPLEQMLRLFTTSPALRLGKEGVKGYIQPGADADLISLTPDLQLTHVIAKGKVAMKQGRLLMKGTFEE
jgi:beta-aspartyl-dipeptidase (metallo-type)